MDSNEVVGGRKYKNGKGVRASIIKVEKNKKKWGWRGRALNMYCVHVQKCDAWPWQKWGPWRLVDPVSSLIHLPVGAVAE